MTPNFMQNLIIKDCHNYDVSEKIYKNISNKIITRLTMGKAQ